MDTIITNIDLLIPELKSKLNNTLPGRDAQSKMISQFQRSLVEYFNEDKKLRDAAVLIILFKDGHRLKTILIERMPDPGPHSGQIAFPGGRKESFDSDLIDTAIREAEEEIGVKTIRENIIGCLTKVEIPVSGFSVVPVVGVINEYPVIMPCPREVNNVFIVDLIELFESKTTKIIEVRGSQIEVPCYVINNKQVVWGATAMVLSEFEEIFNQISKS